MKKNILFISFDDMTSFWPIRSAFREVLQIPNLDRICAEATSFHAAYAAAPVCGPSRASFMSGRSPRELGVLDNNTSVFDVWPAAAMWPARLKEAGYFCSSGGKIHHGYRPLPPVPHGVLYNDGRKRFPDDMKPPEGAAIKQFGGHRKGLATTDPADDGTFYDHQVADSAISFLQSYDGAAPFYREVGFYSPHGPHITPARFKEMYLMRRFTPPKSWEKGFGCDDDIPELQGVKPRFGPGKERYWRACVRNYFSAISHGDYHLGRVWDALMASPHANNTLVVICADHGFHLGDRGRFSKFTMFEQSARVPLIIWDPSRREAKVVNDPVALLDLGPTMLDWAGLGWPADWAGRSLLPYVRGEASDPDRAVLTVWDGGAAIRKGDYRLIRYASGHSQLFDVAKDYWQVDELGRDHPAFAQMNAALDAVLAKEGRYLERPPEIAAALAQELAAAAGRKHDFQPKSEPAPDPAPDPVSDHREDGP